MASEERIDAIERRLDALERRLELFEETGATDERRNRRARAVNMWLRIAVYVSFLLLMVLFLFILKVRF
jgi:hypothetical protein